jgi:hypothetical protein
MALTSWLVGWLGVFQEPGNKAIGPRTQKTHPAGRPHQRPPPRATLEAASRPHKGQH